MFSSFKQTALASVAFIFVFYSSAQAQQNTSRGLLQEDFISKHFISPQFEKSPGLKLTSVHTIDSLFEAIDAAWKRAAPDTLTKYKINLSAADFTHIDAYGYFWTLISITQQINLPSKYQQYLVKNYMLPAMERDYQTLKQTPGLTTIQLISSATLGNTLALGTDNGADKETILSCYRVYSEFAAIFKSLAKADTAISNYAKTQLLDLERFKYDINAKFYFYNGDADQAYTYLLTGIATDHYSKRRAWAISKKLLNYFIRSGDRDKSFALLNSLVINTTPDNINRDTLLNWYLKIDPVTGKQMYANTINKLSASAFKKTGQVIKLPPNFNFILNPVLPGRLKQVKYFLVDVWHTSCGPCLLEIPELNSFYDELKERSDVQFISINTDYFNGKMDAEYVAKRSGELNVKFPVLYDNVISSLNSQLSVHAYPSKFIIDSEGAIMAKTDNSDWSVKAFELFIRELK